ncbi:MAG: amidohydrolase family protein [Planctomycetes bacterium]|nr:amidohydrolase family protein [Planctomycetota bacterium]
MLLDCHVHLEDEGTDFAQFNENCQALGVDGVALLSLAPQSVPVCRGFTNAGERLAHVLAWGRAAKGCFPFFWIDPTEADAGKQVEAALAGGVDGFKIIPNHFYPGDPRCVDICRQVAAADKPVLFHSGILWDGTPSSKYCRPVEFEAMLDVPKLRFALAHISWPWTDECIAVYGKFAAAKRSRPKLSCEMFIDTTPGTPAIYRKDAFFKLWNAGCKVEDNVIFGTDGHPRNYTREKMLGRIDADRKLYNEMGLSPDVQQKIFAGNLLRLIGKKA